MLRLFLFGAPRIEQMARSSRCVAPRPWLCWRTWRVTHNLPPQPTLRLELALIQDQEARGERQATGAKSGAIASRSSPVSWPLDLTAPQSLEEHDAEAIAF